VQSVEYLEAGEVVPPVSQEDITTDPNSPSSFFVLAEYPKDARDVEDAYTKPPPRTDVHFCFPRTWIMHYNAFFFVQEGALTAPCFNGYGTPVSCFFDDRAECSGII
jgi:hypothetical protein